MHKGEEEAGWMPLDPGEPGGWWLAAEGGLVHRGERAAVVADVHLGYEWARAAGGDMVPPHSLAETIGKLERMLARAPVDRLVVAGDLVETPRPCPRTRADVARLEAWLAARGVALVALRGNHDPPSPPRPGSIEVGGWRIAHGDRPLDPPDGRWITGHLHPALRFEGHTAPCFLAGPNRIVLPAFSLNAAGLDVRSGAWPPDLRRLRCVAALDGHLLDFGNAFSSTS